jgi:hypothetical protein
MKKVRRPRATKATRRNPFARALATPKFRPRVANLPGQYRRRPKHVIPPDDET